MSVASEEKIMCHTSVRSHVTVLITCTNEKAKQIFLKHLPVLLWHVVKSFEVAIILGLYVENTCRFPLNL